MHGNVFEWCQDAWQATLPAEPVTDPDGAEGDTGQRVVRGGSWYNVGRLCRSAYRGWLTPDLRDYNLGFRLALGHPSSSQEQAGSKHGQARYGVAPDRDGSQTAVGRAGQWLKSTFNKWRGK